MQLGELIEKMTTSDRLVIINAARKTGKAVYIQIGEEIWDCAGNQKASAVLF